VIEKGNGAPRRMCNPAMNEFTNQNFTRDRNSDFGRLFVHEP